MNKLNTLIVVTLISFTAPLAYAAPVDEGPPAQSQKKAPDTTQNGDYLEPQPVENNDAATQSSDTHHKKDGKHKSKGKNVTNKPKDGGVNVDQR